MLHIVRQDNRFPAEMNEACGKAKRRGAAALQKLQRRAGDMVRAPFDPQGKQAWSGDVEVFWGEFGSHTVDFLVRDFLCDEGRREVGN